MTQKNSNNKLLTILLAVVIIFSIAVLAYTSLAPPTENETNNTAPSDSNGTDASKEPIILTITYGEDSQKFTLTQLKNMEYYTGYGGYRTSFPAIKGQGNYTGIPITSLLIPYVETLDSYKITVIAEDDYRSNYTYDEIMGNVSVYDATNASNENPIATGGVTLLLVYTFEGNPLNISQDGHLKIAYVNGPETITSSKYWAKYVTEIHIIGE
ncbi:MAG: hypothetical protein KKC68_03290 [Candidatus Thermoplasmatota archaeon]|nr:hypothetical protein [Candidatus Thermoplasmatota archaeon]MBU1940777.1 hypothetical protein [Candidatus Thermoplasmatota archaeon]